MADIFLSYSRADRPKAEQVAKALEAEGFSVWWDKVLRAGQTYDEVTEGMLRDSSVVVVLWSEVSVKSKWVRAEATLGERSSVVIPAMIQDAERPIMFELTQTADLIGWDGDRSDPRWQGFVADIRLALERANTDEKAAEAARAPAAPDATIENTFWTSIKDSDDPADFEAYLSRYPGGHFVDLARNRLAALSRNGAAANAPPAPAPAPAAAPRPAPAAATPVPAGKRPSPVILGGAAVAIAAVAIIAAVALNGSGTGDAGAQADMETPAGPTVFADCDVCPSMVVVPAGTFSMGSAESEVGRTGNESPLHPVTLRTFAIGETEITFDQWDACVNDGGCGGYSPPDRDFGRGAQPVIGVSWYDAGAYATWLSRKTGRSYRLPTEAEWEYAARAGTTTPYWWGENFDPAIAPVNAPVPPDTLAANPFGLKAMLGNAREWVEDCYINNYTTAPSGGSAQHDGDCARRVLRGGAWGRDPDDHRAANRARIDASVRDKVFGFRLVTTQLPSDTE
ncbi:MAG: SUMF1/EgtB/PvdO family nonheme iron enzyme [Hyphomonas sp.]